MDPNFRFVGIWAESAWFLPGKGESSRLAQSFEGQADRLAGFAGRRVIQPLEADDPAFAVFHQDDFLASLFADVLRLWTAKPNGQRATLRVIINIHFGHIFSPSLMALVTYAVMRKPDWPYLLLTAHTQRRVRRLR
jgi:hypothetical protein